jgi:hypothetical protein
MVWADNPKYVGFSRIQQWTSFFAKDDQSGSQLSPTLEERELHSGVRSSFIFDLITLKTFEYPSFGGKQYFLVEFVCMIVIFEWCFVNEGLIKLPVMVIHLITQPKATLIIHDLFCELKIFPRIS